MGSKLPKTKPCPNCHKEPATIHMRLGVLPGKKCQERDENERQVQNPEFYNISKFERINKQRDEFKGDLAQPWADGKPNPLFARTYPDKVGDYFTPEEIKNL